MTPFLFNEKGVAKYTCRVIVYTFDPLTKVYTGPATTRVLKGTGIPGNTTFDPVPDSLPKGTALVRKDGGWISVEDHRGALIVEAATGRIFTMNTLGVLPNGFNFYKG